METMQEETMATKEMAVQDVRPPEMLKLTAAEIRADVNLIQEVLKAVMIKDVHYGTIPGCDKPSLYKPGAEKILTTFRLNAEPLIDDLSTHDKVHYRIRVRVTHQITGREIGWGVGEASSDEEKYKWKKAVSLEEYNATPEDQRRLKYYKEGKPAMQIRTNPADVANTILKMCKKRGLVDATLTCTGASDVFDQDIEDLPEGVRQNIVDASRPPMPSRATEKVAYTPPPANVNPKWDRHTGEITEPASAEPPKGKRLDMSKAQTMAAKFTADCKFCGKKVMEGEQQIYVREGADKGPYHVACIIA